MSHDISHVGMDVHMKEIWVALLLPGVLSTVSTILYWQLKGRIQPFFFATS